MKALLSILKSNVSQYKCSTVEEMWSYCQHELTQISDKAIKNCTNQFKIDWMKSLDIKKVILHISTNILIKNYKFIFLVISNIKGPT